VPVPDYQTLMAPTLQALSDGASRSVAAVREIVAERLGISVDDRRELIKSGSPVFDSRVQSFSAGDTAWLRVFTWDGDVPCRQPVPRGRAAID
jgi:restriction endonuclease Mrr